MIQLPKNCYCGQLSVKPKNWLQAGASLNDDWYIHYRFYDPNYKERYPKGFLKIIKGMNDSKTLEERRSDTKQLLSIEQDLLKNEGYNPITKTIGLTDFHTDIDPCTDFLTALKYSFSKIKVEKGTRTDMTSILKYVIIALVRLQYQSIEISKVRRKHIKLILEEVAEIRKISSNSRYNKYRTYLMILFEELMQLDAIEHNPAKDIRKKKEIRRIREVLTQEQRIQVNEFLFENYRNFWRLLHIFFHSGSREIELMRVKRKDVDIVNQRCKYLVKKGGQWHEVWRPIKTIILDLWKEQIAPAQPEDYIFAKKLVPGPVRIDSSQITKRWYRLVKMKLGITADFYPLKHLNTDETAALLNLKDAAAQNSHTSTVITMKYYAFGEQDRQNERLKNLENKFA